MKKWFIVLAAGILAACASVNKNTVNYQMSLFDQTRYYVVAGEGAQQEEASAAALSNMRKEFERAAELANTQILDDILANAKVEKVWKEKIPAPKIILPWPCWTEL